MDTEDPYPPAGGMPVATGAFTVERDVAALCRLARGLGPRLGAEERDVRSLAALIAEAARRLTACGARGEVELGVRDGPCLQIEFHVTASPEVIQTLDVRLASLRAIAGGLRVAHTGSGATLRAAVPIRSSPAALPVPPLTFSALPGGSLPRADLVLPAEPADAGSAADHAAGITDTLAETDRHVADLYGDLAELTARLEAVEARCRGLEDALRSRDEALMAANRATEDFLSTLSHELRTPLNAMLGWTRLLRLGRLDAHGAARALEALERSAEVQARLIADILDASSIVTGRLQLELQPAWLGGIVSTVVDAMRPHAQAKNVTIQADVAFHGRVPADAVRLEQVVRNLLGNAIKFTPEGGRVRVSLTSEGGDAVLVVSDTGEGIDQAFLPFVFERFRHADSSPTRAHGGLGLGLSIVRHIVDMHGGRVDVASEGPGRGASFVVRLPADP